MHFRLVGPVPIRRLTLDLLGDGRIGRTVHFLTPDDGRDWFSMAFRAFRTGVFELFAEVEDADGCLASTGLQRIIEVVP